jgi:hypothetical protein
MENKKPVIQLKRSVVKKPEIHLKRSVGKIKLNASDNYIRDLIYTTLKDVNDTDLRLFLLQNLSKVKKSKRTYVKGVFLGMFGKSEWPAGRILVILREVVNELLNRKIVVKKPEIEKEEEELFECYNILTYEGFKTTEQPNELNASYSEFKSNLEKDPNFYKKIKKSIAKVADIFYVYIEYDELKKRITSGEEFILDFDTVLRFDLSFRFFYIVLIILYSFLIESDVINLPTIGSVYSLSLDKPSLAEKGNIFYTYKKSDIIKQRNKILESNAEEDFTKWLGSDQAEQEGIAVGGSDICVGIPGEGVERDPVNIYVDPNLYEYKKSIIPSYNVLENDFLPYCLKENYGERFNRIMEKYQVYQVKDLTKDGVVEKLNLDCVLNAFAVSDIDENWKKQILSKFYKGTIKCSSDTRTIIQISSMFPRLLIETTYYGLSKSTRKRFYIKGKPLESEPKKDCYDSSIKLGYVDLHHSYYKYHCVLNEKIEISKIALENYEEIKKQGMDWTKINSIQTIKGKKYFTTKKNIKKISSFKFIQFLVDNKDKYLCNMPNELYELTEEISIRKNVSYDDIKEYFYNHEFKPEEEEEKEKEKETEIEVYGTLCEYVEPSYFFAFGDCECQTYDDNYEPINHTLHSVGLKLLDAKTKSGKTELYLERENTCDNIDKKFYDELKDILLNINKKQHPRGDGSVNMLLYFHNMKYDFSILFKTIYSELISENRIKILRSTGGIVYGVEILPLWHAPTKKKLGGVRYIIPPPKIIIKDSFKLVSLSLRKWAEAFKLDIEKEDFPYELTNMNNFKNGVSDRSIIKENTKIKPIIKQSVKDICFKNGWFKEKDGETYYDIQKYNKFYNMRDCELLSQCFIKLRSIINKEFNLNIEKYYTTPSMAKSYQEIKGCFEGVEPIDGLVQQFVQRAVVGGRVCVEWNKKKQNYESVYCYDCNSLYPTAMRIGFVKGKPKLCTREIFERRRNDDDFYYIIEIKVTKINKKRAIPIYYERIKGLLNWTNEASNTETHVIDRTTLEDFEKYNEIEYEVIGGIYFDEGRNMKVAELMNDIYSKRSKAREDKNVALDTCYKLFLNSPYGKLIEKQHNVVIDYVIDKDLEKFLEKKKRRTILYKKFTENVWEVHSYKKGKQFEPRFTHCGVNILSQSKHLINEFMYKLEDNGIATLYGDTDSLFIEKKYESKMLELVPNFKGEQLGQFKIDKQGFLLDKFQVYDKKFYRAQGTKNSETKVFVTSKGVSPDLFYGEKGEKLFNDLMNDIPVKCEQTKPSFRYSGMDVKTMYMIRHFNVKN